jgi:competence protein ComEC
VVLSAGALVARRPWLLCLGVAVLASSLGGRAWAGLGEAPLGTLAGRATLVSDPEPIDRGVSVGVRLGSHRYEARAFGGAAGRLHDRAAGDVVELRGVARHLPPEIAGWLAPRHVGAGLTVDEVGAWSPGGPPARLANVVRRTLDTGASVLPPDQRALFAGFVLGDDRQQPAAVADDFRAAGLTHLLAVSGQNVAFVLAVAAPALRRFGLRGRLLATLALIGFFAMVTRFEPSVVRASAMAALAAVVTTAGREASGLRLLALAVAALVVVDPLLVHSIGFGLSVGASAGIVLLARPLGRALPGPLWLADGVGVTVAAQIGVAPLLVPAFGGLPVAALPANLLAVPAAGPLMAWGMTAGLVAGVLVPLLGDGVGLVLHAPTAVLITWIATVARVAARLPLGQLGLIHVAVACVGGVVLALTRRRLSPQTGIRALSRSLACLAVVVPVVVPIAGALSASSHRSGQAARGAEVWTSGGGPAVVVLDGRARAGPVLEGVRRMDVRAVGAVAVRSGAGSPGLVDTLDALVERYSPELVLAPPGASVRGSIVPAAGRAFLVGDLVVTASRVTPTRLEITVRSRAPPH